MTVGSPPASTLRPFHIDPDAEFWRGDVREVALAIPPNSIQALIFSPPYYGLRRYKTPPVIWGGAPGCRHEWGPLLVTSANDNLNEGFNERWGQGAGERRQEEAKPKELDLGRFCTVPDCTAWEGHLGNEPTPQMFLDHMMEILDALHAILRRDGTLWMVIGDSYAGSGRGPSGKDGLINHSERQGFADVARELKKWRKDPGWWGLADKCLLMIPHRLAIMMASRGWIIRNDVVWSKPNASPMPIEDRFITSHEYIFLAAKTESRGKYYFDHVAVQEVSVTSAKKGRAEVEMADGTTQSSGMRNRRTVWTIPTASAHTKSDHFATYPKSLATLMVLASTSAVGACRKCGAAFERITFRESAPAAVKRAYARRSDFHQTNKGLGGSVHQKWLDDHPLQTIGWKPTCKCGCQIEIQDKPAGPLRTCGGKWTVVLPPETKMEVGDDGAEHEVVIKPAVERFDCGHGPTDALVPCRVGDLFGGSGTTLAACRELSRYGVYGDLSDEYAEEATGRAEGTQPGLGLY